MGLRAYLMVNCKDDVKHEDFRKAILDLEDMIEVDFVDPVVGNCDMVIMVEAAVSVEKVARQIAANEWVENVAILKIVSIFERHRTSKRELLKALQREKEEVLT
ncbi:hypothetical protein [Dethiobacter alkaliphilus]|uniref:hypothetical protein n=1 Tax=Dethiobacter alkaliphilus TaxID=427926 RepID=UPI002227F3A5|nr:hypothetical protein [Dethiobacter alkaliphilus]MCW3490113.1 hypothetical protein [Dethiobacter alkaliphilus]